MEYSRDRESPAAPIIVGPFGPVIAVLLPASGLVPSCGLRSEERGVVLVVVRHAPTLCLLCRRQRRGHTTVRYVMARLTVPCHLLVSMRPSHGEPVRRSGALALTDQ